MTFFCQVLSLENETRRRRVKYQDVLSYDINVPGQEIQEKRTRFSLSHDQESIGTCLKLLFTVFCARSISGSSGFNCPYSVFLTPDKVLNWWKYQPPHGTLNETMEYIGL